MVVLEFGNCASLFFFGCVVYIVSHEFADVVGDDNAERCVCSSGVSDGSCVVDAHVFAAFVHAVFEFYAD